MLTLVVSPQAATLPGVRSRPAKLEYVETAIVQWDDGEQVGNREWLNWYRHILAVRRAGILPCVQNLTGGEACYSIRGHQAVTVQWLCSEGLLLRLNANLSDFPCGGLPLAGIVKSGSKASG
jgi:hypothetical protein